MQELLVLASNEVVERLLDEEAIAVMPGESFGSAAAGHIRIAMTVPDEDLGRAVARIVALADRIAGERPAAVSAR